MVWKNGMPIDLMGYDDMTDPDLLACLDNYHVRLLVPAQMEDSEIMKFHSSLHEVMLFIKYSKDRKNLDKILKTNEKRFRELERRVTDEIEVITNSGLNYSESEEAVDVCQAIQEMRMESEQKGRLMQAKESARKLYEMGINVEKIAQVVGYAVERVNGWLELSDDNQ